MTLAILSDTHGNLSALNAALKDMQAFGIERILCLGDVANFGPQPQATLHRIRELNCPVVMGNTDAYLLKPRTLEDVAEPDEETPRFLELEAWSAEQLDEHDKDFIHGFQPTLELELNDILLLAYHGSPQSYHDIITATTPDDVLDSYFEDSNAGVYAGGHTHTQFVRRHHSSRLLNPGSVGLPYLTERKTGRATNPAVAEYALLEVTGGEPNITLRRVPYKVQSVMDAVKTSGMPHAAWWLEGFLG